MAWSSPPAVGRQGRPQQLRARTAPPGHHPEKRPPQPPPDPGHSRAVPADAQELAGRPRPSARRPRRLQALLDAFTHTYNHQRPHRSLPYHATPATAYAARPKPPPATATTTPTTASAATSSAPPGRLPCATAAASTTSASAEPTPEPTSCYSPKTATSASSTPSPANCSASSPSTPPATTSTPGGHPAANKHPAQKEDHREPSVGSRCPRSRDITWVRRQCLVSGHANLRSRLRRALHCSALTSGNVPTGDPSGHALGTGRKAAGHILADRCRRVAVCCQPGSAPATAAAAKANSAPAGSDPGRSVNSPGARRLDRVLPGAVIREFRFMSEGEEDRCDVAQRGRRCRRVWRKAAATVVASATPATAPSQRLAVIQAPRSARSASLGRMAFVNPPSSGQGY